MKYMLRILNSLLFAFTAVGCVYHNPQFLRVAVVLLYAETVFLVVVAVGVVVTMSADPAWVTPRATWSQQIVPWASAILSAIAVLLIAANGYPIIAGIAIIVRLGLSLVDARRDRLSTHQTTTEGGDSRAQ